MTKQDVLETILKAVCHCTGIGVQEMSSRQKSKELNTARGVYYLLAHKLGYKQKDVCQLIGRSRPSCIITTKVYCNYYETKDPLTLRMYSDVRDEYFRIIDSEL